MKKLCIVLAIVLLSSVMLSDAQRFPGGGLGGLRCGRQVCRRGQRCIEVPVRCFRAPCPRLFRCV
ncbi:uncharacterized protein LOC142790000 [Rhipicephalus microplus]|uniref:uncharacterized protein LOC142790000 n=1 Tax=Rhipicephalus microplus TaxID=6941 RepID=UPI003F6CDE74